MIVVAESEDAEILIKQLGGITPMDWDTGCAGTFLAEK